jgi:uncharacterized iron-regulated membrane protein
MTRHYWVLFHRYAGLMMTLFLVIVALTGSVLAFKDELDLWLNPDLLCVEERDAPMLDPLVLRERAEETEPDMRADEALLHVVPGRSFEVSLAPRVKNTAVKELITLPGVLGAFNKEEGIAMIYLDPYTGKKIGERNLTKGLHGRKDIIWFLYRLHMMLALPANFAGLGARILGVVALVWTIDCFVGGYLTLPPRPRKQFLTLQATKTRHERCTRPSVLRIFWQRWKVAWKFKWPASFFRVNFDLHRAFGLWTWAMLFIFAWSSVLFNLDEVYYPVMNTLFGAPPPELPAPAMPTRVTPLENPKLGWMEARTRGRVLLDFKAHKDGFTIKYVTILLIDRDTGRYTMCADTLVRAEDGQACVEFDADTGKTPPEAPQATPEVKEAETRLSDTISSWLSMLHMAKIFGLPMKIFVCFMGLVITLLSMTGVYIWWKKHRAANAMQKKTTTTANTPGLNN